LNTWGEKLLTIPKSVIGISLLILSVVLSSIGQVFYAKHVQSMSPFLFTFMSFVITISIFHCMYWMNRSTQRTTEMKVKKGYRFIILSNIATASVVVSFYYALKYVEPAVVSAIQMGIGPVIVLIVTYIVGLTNKGNTFAFLTTLGILIGTIILTWATISGKSGIHTDSEVGSSLFLGIVLSFLAGIGAVGVTLTSKKLNNEGWSPIQILSHRFYAVTIITGTLIFMEKSYQDFSKEELPWLLLITVFGVSMPLFFLQIGIKYSKPIIVMVILALIPAITFFFQLFDSRIQWSNITLVGVCCITVCSIVHIYMEQTQGKKAEEKYKHRVIG
jgi:drug/metabolite transporter (DMT)-like permease